MRFGICAISAILPKFLRSLLRPVKERVIRGVLYGLGAVIAVGVKPSIQNQWRKPPTPPVRESPEGGGLPKYARQGGFSTRAASFVTSTRLSRRRLRAAF